MVDILSFFFRIQPVTSNNMRHFKGDALMLGLINSPLRKEHMKCVTSCDGRRW